ncbi:MAG: hypothetical protein AB7E95_02890 [Kiritimatiellales bacterium]
MKKIVMLLTIVLPFVGKAIITADNSTAETDPYGSTGFDWSYVYEHPDGSAVAVDAYWVLTASHVADYGGAGTLTINGTNYYQQEIVYHESADLALIRYDKALPGFYSLYSGELVPKNPNNQLSVVMVGYGHTGTASSASWTDSGSGRGTERWGTQKIDSTQTLAYNAGGTTGITTNNGFWMDFNLGDTTYEAGVGVYDSGGGTFYNDNGTWKLAGINTVRIPVDSPYNSTFSVSAGAYEPWISQTVPEPSTAIQLVLIAVGVSVVNRYRCMCR